MFIINTDEKLGMLIEFAFIGLSIYFLIESNELGASASDAGSFGLRGVNIQWRTCEQK